VKEGVFMHGLKVYKPKATCHRICNDCHSPKLQGFKGTLKEVAWMHRFDSDKYHTNEKHVKHPKDDLFYENLFTRL
jgi:hypothetical protein